MADRVTEQGREAGERMQEVAGNLKGALDKSIKDQPMATLVGAAILGFILSQSGSPKHRRGGGPSVRGPDQSYQGGRKRPGLQIRRSRIGVAVPFIIALAAITGMLVQHFGHMTAYWVVAGGLAAIGVVAAIAVGVKEHEEEVAKQAEQ